MTLIKQRDQQLRKVYSTLYLSSSANSRLISRDLLLDLMMEQPAPRFYITPKMAERYVLGFKKQSSAILSSRKLEMIKDLVSAYERARTRHKGVAKGMLWKYTVESPAKSFYMTKQRLEEVIFNYTYRNGKESYPMFCRRLQGSSN